MSSVFFNKGENCIAAGRLFVEDSIHDQFVQKVVSSTAESSLGQPRVLQGAGDREAGLGHVASGTVHLSEETIGQSCILFHLFFYCFRKK